MSENDNQVPNALVRAGARTLAVRSATLIKRGLALAKSLQPDDEDAHFDLGDALYKMGNLDGAIAEYRTAIRLNPDYAKGHFYLGLALSNKGDLDGAIAEWRTPIRLQPGHASTHVLLGLALDCKGDLDGAIAEYRTALRLQPDNANAHGLLGFALDGKGDPDGAIAELRTAIRLQPDYVLAHYNLGVALYQKGDRRAALEEFRAAYLLDPKNSAIAQQYERLLGEVKPVGGSGPVINSIASVSVAENREWQDAKLIKITSDPAGTAAIVLPMGTGLMGVSVPMTRAFYWVETDHMIYVLPVLPGFCWHCKSSRLNMTVNRKTKIAVDGMKAHILNDAGQDVKFSIVQKIAKD